MLNFTLLDAQMMDERRQPIPAEVARNEDGTQTVNYTPRSIGTFTASVAYGAPEGGAAAGPSAGGPVPGSPFSISVHPDVDVSKIYVEGLEPSAHCSHALLTYNVLYKYCIEYFFFYFVCYVYYSYALREYMY